MDEPITVAGRQWTTYAGAAHLLGVPVGTLAQWVHRGHVTARTVAGCVWIDLEQAQDRERVWRADPRTRQRTVGPAG